MLPTISIGPLVIPLPILLLLIGIWIGFNQSERYADFFGIDREQIASLLLYFLIAFLLGARLSFFASNPMAFSNNWLSILSLNPNMMDWSGGLLLGLFTTGIFISRKKMDLWKTLDGLTPAILIFLLFQGVSFLASGQFYGIPTELPWAINFLGISRHPTQIYWIIMFGVVLILTWPRLNMRWYPGLRFLGVLSLTSITILFLDYFRADSRYLVGGLKSDQVSSFLMLLATLWQFGILIRKFQSELMQEVHNGSNPDS